MLTDISYIAPSALSKTDIDRFITAKIDNVMGYSGVPHTKVGLTSDNIDCYAPADKLRILGAVQWLLSLSKPHHHYTQAMIQLRLYPCISLNMFRLYFAGGMPVAFANWAWVNDEVQERMETQQGLIGLDEWASGDNLWFTEIIAPFGHSDRIIWDFSDIFAFGGIGKTVFANDDGTLKSFRNYRFPIA